MSEGAVASIAATKAFEQACPFVKTIVAYGISMGGNTSGLAAASHATRHDGRPLFDYWWDIEGATNVIETYAGARALAATGNAFAVGAQQDIEAEMGGPIEAQPQAYVDHAVVTHGPDSEAGTTLDGYLPVPHDSPFAGHGSETSNTQLVIKTGFDRLASYFSTGDAPACREFVVDGTTGVTAGIPTTGC